MKPRAAKRLRFIQSAITSLGPGWVARRGAYELARRCGVLVRRTPRGSWEMLAAELEESGEKHAFVAELPGRLGLVWPSVPPGLLSRFADARLENEVNALLSGDMRFFGGRARHVGFPPNWHRDPETGTQIADDVHWSRIADCGPYDIKRVWEPSRFTWALHLARLEVRTRDGRWAEAFWALLGEWMQNNPPNSGPNWMCGQEAALRLVAVTLAAAHMPGGKADYENLALLAVATGRRIEANIGYALSQRNNHGLSEAVGLWLAGTLCGGLPEAVRWRKTGRGLVKRQVLELFAEGGAFSQYSINYHRLALEVCMVGVLLANAEGRPLSGEVLSRLQAAAGWLVAVLDRESGGVPRFGQWDGAHLFPLSACGFDDFRPVVQAASVILSGEPVLPDGPWDEQVLWLTGGVPAGPPAPQAETKHVWEDDSGYVVLRDETGMAFSRAGSFSFRPSQADLLHVDIWWRGINVAMDPGTFSYNDPEPWRNPLASTRFHNTVNIHGSDQMRKVARFLWAPWPAASGRAAVSTNGGAPVVWEGKHDGYKRLGLGGWHHRAVLSLGGGRWVVVDRLDVKSPRGEAILHWLLPSVPHRWNSERRTLLLELSPGPFCVAIGSEPVPERAGIVGADPESPRGWFAPRYGERRPAVSLEVATRGASPVFVTYLGPDAAAAGVAKGGAIVTGPDWALELTLEEDGRSENLLAAVRFEPQVKSRMA